MMYFSIDGALETANINDFLDNDAAINDPQEDNIPDVKSAPKNANFTKEQCPISLALQTLTKTGSSQSADTTNLAIIGGEEIVCDSAQYFITMDTIEVARFEAKYTHAPEEEKSQAIAQICERMFKQMGADLIDSYSALFPRVLVNSPLLIEQFQRIVILIGVICETAPKSMTLYEFELVNNAGFVLARRPDVLEYQLNQLNIFLRRFAPKFSLIVPEFPTLAIPSFPANQMIRREATIEGVKSLLEMKLILLNYMCEVEKLHVAALRYLENVIKNMLTCLKERNSI